MNNRNEPKIILSEASKKVAAQKALSASSSSSSLPEYQYLFRFQVIGDSGSGKSCLILRYINNEYSNRYISDLGRPHHEKTIKLADKTIKTWVRDSNGSEYVMPTSEYYQRCHAVMLVFDLTDQVSFNNLPEWITKFRAKEGNDADIILIGTKCDIPTKRVVELDQIKTYMTKTGIDCYIETSALTGENVNLAFETAAKTVLTRLRPELFAAPPAALATSSSTTAPGFMSWVGSFFTKQPAQSSSSSSSAGQKPPEKSSKK